MKKQIILASSSPRRIEMIKVNGIDPIICPSNAEETVPICLSLDQTVMYLALKKALEVEQQWNQSGQTAHNDMVIIAADTTVYKDRIMGKPIDWNDAEQTLKFLRGTHHLVATGVALVSPNKQKRTVFYEVTKVFFHQYTDEDIIEYLNTDEPWDKAGSYAIQGIFSKHIQGYEGSYENVIGFPWDRIQSELKENWPEIIL